MCAVSQLYAYMENIPLDYWNRDKWEHFQMLVEDTRVLDEMLNQPDCEEVSKEEWERNVQAFLDRTYPES